ncbi:predicted periplasmic/secreted protein [Serpentinimonas raichei]|uniref:Predicted periplasmic/secreted protein n=1 Tax=Serpentinimonas raichei TaxID=1458425 RepID=A0A060NNC0_9BURK|nr:SIMPL domain-containing protein [Serpentinimonas raichei]BAO80399.1 predicted periplasmic/secreted protein [Serpentinimonas raichei]
MIFRPIFLSAQLRYGLAGLALGLGLLGAGAAAAQVSVNPAALQPLPHNVVQLSATAQQPVRQDWLTLTLAQRVQGADPAALQRQLSQSVEAALRQLRPQVRAGEFELGTGHFSLQPRHDPEGQIVGWIGSAELLLQGRDVAGLATAAAQVRGLNVAQMAFTLSPQARQQVEASVRSAAIERFRASAQQVARDFGFTDYRLREIAISDGEQDFSPRPRLMMAAQARLDGAEAALPAEPGTAQVQVTVTGTVQLQ